MSNILRMYPIILNYKTLHIAITDKEDGVIVELTSKHIIHTNYNPKTNKGKRVVSKIILSNNERLGTKDNGLSLHLSIQPELGWFATLVENENSISVELYTGEVEFELENTTKNSNGTSQHTVVIKLMNTIVSDE